MDDCDVLMGIKEVPVKMLIPGKTYLFFSHTKYGVQSTIDGGWRHLVQLKAVHTPVPSELPGWTQSGHLKGPGAGSSCVIPVSFRFFRRQIVKSRA